VNVRPSWEIVVGASRIYEGMAKGTSSASSIR
jgi:hypothetical protein